VCRHEIPPLYSVFCKLQYLSMEHSSDNDQGGYVEVRNFGGPAPHITIVTSDNYAIIVSAKVLSDAS
jgi:hypothetical protein